MPGFCSVDTVWEGRGVRTTRILQDAGCRHWTVDLMKVLLHPVHMGVLYYGRGPAVRIRGAGTQLIFARMTRGDIYVDYPFLV